MGPFLRLRQEYMDSHHPRMDHIFIYYRIFDVFHIKSYTFETRTRKPDAICLSVPIGKEEKTHQGSINYMMVWVGIWCMIVECILSLLMYIIRLKKDHKLW